MITYIFLVFFASVGFCFISLYLLMKIITYRVLSDEDPPLVPGNWLFGGAIEFGTHAVKYLHKCMNKYGPIFTIRLLHEHLTVIADPHLYDTFVKEKAFSFVLIQRQVNQNVFGFKLTDYKTIRSLAQKKMQGESMRKVLQTFVASLNDTFLKRSRIILNTAFLSTKTNPDMKKGVIMGLKEYTAKSAFAAIYEGLYGKTSTSYETSMSLYKSFEIFHQYFGELWLGLPHKFFPKAEKAAADLFNLPIGKEVSEQATCCDYLKASLNHMNKLDCDMHEIKGHNLVLTHVHYQSYRTLFWTLYYLMTNSIAKKELLNELKELAIQAKTPRTPGVVKAFNFDFTKPHAFPTVVMTQDDLDACHVTESIIKETMRMASGVFMIRQVTEDVYISSGNGKPKLVRKGDRVAMYPPVHHLDPEIFENPEVFKWDRFLPGTNFTKNGKVLDNPLLPFGSVCPGKRYAINEMKLFLISMFNCIDISLADENEKTELDVHYYGHEILPPTNDVKIKITSRGKDAIKIVYEPQLTNV